MPTSGPSISFSPLHSGTWWAPACFGFLINPPIVLYYIQGMNTTPIHAHTALFGVYGFLAIALMLFSLRHIIARHAWSDRMLKWSFWGLNIGLVTMTVFSLIPSGFLPDLFRGEIRCLVREEPGNCIEHNHENVRMDAGCARSQFSFQVL